VSSSLVSPATEALDEFVHHGRFAPYKTSAGLVFPVHCKTGLAAARHIMLPHTVVAAAGVVDGDRIRYAARWLCPPGGGSTDAVVLADAESAGGLCRRCTISGLDDGPGVYRLFGHEGELLYVGSAARVQARIAQHEISKRWRGQLGGTSFTRYRTLAEAATAEVRAIRTEHPLLNVLVMRTAATTALREAGGAA
jgi:hypothetical protein